MAELASKDPEEAILVNNMMFLYLSNLEDGAQSSNLFALTALNFHSIGA